MTFCSNCGAPLAPDARFCARCGHAVAAATLEETEPGVASQNPRPVPAAVPPPPPSTTTPPRVAVPPPNAPHPTRTRVTTPVAKPADGPGKWWIVPLVIVGLVVIAWLVLAGLPFGGEERDTRGIAVEETGTIAEATAPTTVSPTATIIEVPTERLPTTETILPPLESPDVEAPASSAGVPPGSTPTPSPTQPAPSSPKPSPVPSPAPQPAPSTPAAQPTRITNSDAQARLRSFITSRNYYPDVARSCLQIRDQGFSNEGYGFTVWQACIGGGGAKRVGTWRVDAKNGSLYRRNDNGKYVSP